MKKHQVCILSLSPIQRDGRVLREVNSAAQKHAVTVVGWGTLDKPRDNVTMLPVEKWSFPPHQRLLQAALMFSGKFNPRLWEQWYWRKPDHQQALECVLSKKFDLIHVNEAIALPIALKAAAKMGAKVLFDAHEYTTRQNDNQLLWRVTAKAYYTHVMRTCAPQADAMTTVAPGIAQQYQQEFGLSPSVILNAPHYIQAPYQEAQADHIRMVHHGHAMRERYLEKMIEILALTEPRYTLDFYLVPKAPHYIQALKEKARKLAPGRVHFRNPVPPEKIAETINDYDIGLYLLPPTNFNHVHALPNKFFEFIMAGLAVVIGPSPEMAQICRTHNLGVVTKQFKAAEFAKQLNALSINSINAMKKNALSAAKIFNAETEMQKLQQIYTQLLE